MVKAPSSHGLDRKFKSWRKGKSQNSKRRSSLKQQLRGVERLLKRAKDEQHRAMLQQQVKSLQEEIKAKQQTEQQRTNAKKSHGARFLERQKLVRMERNVLREAKSSSTSQQEPANKSPNEFERALLKIALDQVYVAHFPMDIKYMPLFYQGVRRVDRGSPVLQKRAQIRQRALELAASATAKSKTKSWISAEQYQRALRHYEDNNEWSVEQERALFGQGDDDDDAATKKKDAALHDERFQAAKFQSQHEAMLAAADEMEAQFDREEDRQKQSEQTEERRQEQKRQPANADDSSDSESSSSSSSSSEDEADPLKPSSTTTPRPQQKAEPAHTTATGTDSKRNDDDDDDDHDDSSSVSSSSSSSSSDSSSSDDDSSAGVPPADTATPTDKAEDAYVNDDLEHDDFFVPLKDNNVEADDHHSKLFAKPQERMPGFDPFKGDKSKGWATQRQRPGQFKRHNQNNNKNNNNKRRRRW